MTPPSSADNGLGGASGPLCLVAGAGRFPVLIAREAKRRGDEVLAVGFEGITDKTLSREVGRILWIKLGQIDRPIREMKKAGATRVLMAGRVKHVNIFGGIRPDLRAARILAGLRDRRADTILKALADEFEKDGITLLNSTAYLADAAPEPGILSRRKPAIQERKDIDLGWRVAKAVAAHDVGQTVVVRHGAIVAVEAMEGTDACVLRAGELARSRGKGGELVVVKVAKPKQDLRFDMPVIGLASIESFREAGVRALAVEARRSLLLDRERMLAQANALGLAVCAVERTEGA